MNQPVVIFDGVCSLCNYTVDILIRHDKTGSLMFGSFQDPTPAALLREHNVHHEPTTVYFIEDGKLYKESDAIIRLGNYVRAPYSIIKYAKVFPKGLRDAVYQFVARHRYRVFGKKDTCRVPTPEERARFLV